MTFEEAKQQAIERSEWVLCHGAGYYTARTPDGRDIIGKGENGVFVGGEWAKMHGARFTFERFCLAGREWHEPIYRLITPLHDIRYTVVSGKFTRCVVI